MKDPPSHNEDSDWDVESERSEHEPDEQWSLRKRFMLQHKERFPRERLVSLAQLFINVEFLGCRYPAETMQTVSELSEEVAEQYRQSRKNKLQRTFVKASDAAEAKAKRTYTK